MWGRGRGNTSRARKTSITGGGSTSQVSMPTVSIPISSSQQGGKSSSGGPDHINPLQTLVLLVHLMFKHHVIVVLHSFILNHLL